MKLDRFFWRRVFMSLFGVIICSISVGLFKLAALGVDPFQSFMAGMDALIPIGFGTLYTIVNVILLAFSLIFYRKNIGLATFINMFLLGYITQFSYETFMRWFPAPSMVFRFASLIIAVVVICFGSAFYMTANLGVSTYDAVAITLVEKWHIWKFKYIRICTDLVCVIVGVVIFVIAGHEIKEVPTIAGIGTIITAFFMGPLIDFFNNKIAIPFLNRGKKEDSAAEEKPSEETPAE